MNISTLLSVNLRLYFVVNMDEIIKTTIFSLETH